MNSNIITSNNEAAAAAAAAVDTAAVSTEVRWIESDSLKEAPELGQADNNVDADDDTPDFCDLFADPDPLETFHFEWTIPSTCQDDKRIIELTLQGHKAELGQTLHSTGLTLWRASELLCQYMIQNHADIQGQRVLELGAGLGLCGILAHHLDAATVVLTDGDTDTLEFLRANVARNCTNETNAGRGGEATIEGRQLVWAGAKDERLQAFVEQHGTYDYIVGSDIIYVEQILDPLFSTVRALMTDTGKFWLAYARRNVSIDLVLTKAAKHGFSYTEPDDAEGVFVFTLTPEPSES